jgi:hypothetical protein
MLAAVADWVKGIRLAKAEAEALSPLSLAHRETSCSPEPEVPVSRELYQGRDIPRPRLADSAVLSARLPERVPLIIDFGIAPTECRANKNFIQPIQCRGEFVLLLRGNAIVIVSRIGLAGR